MKCLSVLTNVKINVNLRCLNINYHEEISILSYYQHFCIL